MARSLRYSFDVTGDVTGRFDGYKNLSKKLQKSLDKIVIPCYTQVRAFFTCDRE
jgi:hypothetical protein